MEISVVIPIYNVEQYLQACLESVLRNVEHLDAEVLLVDDGSTDNSLYIAQRFARQHPQFTLLTQANQGPSAARNNALSRAAGDYLFFVDADDLLVDGILAKLLAAARARNAQMAVCEVGRLNPNGMATSSTLQFLAFCTLPNTTTSITQHPKLAYDSITCNKLISRQFFLEHVGKFPVGQHVCEDYTVMLPLYCEASCIAVIPTMGYLWRIREGDNPSLTQQKTELKNLEQRIAALNSVFAYLVVRPELEAIRRITENKVIRFDFNGYISNLHLMDPNTASQFIELTATAVEQYVSPQTIAAAPLKTQQMISYLLARNTEGLITWDAYVHDGYDDATVTREGNCLRIDVPDEVFSIASRDYMPDAIAATPRSRINHITTSDSVVTITGHLHTPRVSINKNEQDVHAYLVNEIAGTKITLPCSSTPYTDLIEDEKSSYNYEGTGFCLCIDFREFDTREELHGSNTVVLEYHNWVKHDFRILRGVNPQARRTGELFTFRGNRITGSLGWDKRSTLVVQLEPKEAVESARLREATLGARYVTAIVPVHNNAKTLVSCLESLQAQHYKRLFVMLLESESTDGSNHICDMFASKSRNTIVRHFTNCSLEDMCQAALDTCPGDYIMFVDPRHTFDKACVVRMHDAMVKADTPVIASSTHAHLSRAVHKIERLAGIEPTSNICIVRKGSAKKLLQKKNLCGMMARSVVNAVEFRSVRSFFADICKQIGMVAYVR